MKRSIFLFTLILVLFSCAKEFDTTTIDEEPFEPITKVEAKSLTVSIGEDIAFTCEINGEMYTSLGGGILLIKNPLLEKMGNLIIIRSNGYFDEIRYVIPSLGSHLYMEVSLSKIKEDNNFCKDLGTIASSDGGMIDEYRIQMEIPPNSFVDEGGNDFQGNVNVFGCNVMNGAYATTIRKFPQNIFVENDALKTLQIAGGLQLVFLDNSDNRLFFKKGNTVQLKIEKFTPLQKNFPDDLDLLYFDNDLKRWEAKGKLGLVDDKWEGTIDNLGLVLWGIKFESKIMKVRLVTGDGFIVPNKYLTVFTDLEMPFMRLASDHQGIVHTLIPVNKDFRLIILDLIGPQPTLEKDYPAVSENSDLIVEYEDLVLFSENYQNYKGSIVDCSDDLILESAILIDAYTNAIGFSNYEAFFFSDETGIFSFAQIKSEDDVIEAKAFDYSTTSLSSQKYIFNYKEKEIDFGSISLCE